MRMPVTLLPLLVLIPPLAGTERPTTPLAIRAALTDTIDLSRYRADLLRRTRDGSWWWTSNEAYREQDGEGSAEAYGMRFWLAPGAISAIGCLWSIHDGGLVEIAWHFQQGWDGTRGRPFVYQAHTSGTGSGFGYVGELTRKGGILDQDFWWTDGTTSRTRHDERWIDDDTRVGASLTWREGEWVPNRSYTWERRRGGNVPCGPSNETRGEGEGATASSSEVDGDPRLYGFDPFIGSWDAPEALVEANPSSADFYARSWSWGPHGTVVKLGETVHKEDPRRTVFEGQAFWHPVRDRVEFTGYNARMLFFFEGYYEFEPGALTRVYRVHYPPDFVHNTFPELTDRVREFRRELRLIAPDVLEQRTFMRVDGEWTPWPTRNAVPVRVRRAEVGL